jgi:predicted lipoprotein with Yx(FWY)xxD motif
MMSKNRSLWLLMLVLSIAALVVAGCGASGQASNSGTSGSSVTPPTATTGTASASGMPAASNGASTAGTTTPGGATGAYSSTTGTSATGAMTSTTGTTASSATTSTQGTSANGPAGLSAPSGPAQVTVVQNATLGNILADNNGMTLYLYTKDSKDGPSTCYGGCAKAWPPLLTKGNAQAGSEADAKLLGTTNRTDGTTQVTYNGWPLYYFAKDTKAGDVTGQGVGGVWFVVSPQGDKIQK